MHTYISIYIYLKYSHPWKVVLGFLRVRILTKILVFSILISLPRYFHISSFLCYALSFTAIFLRHAKQRKEGERSPLFPSFVFHALEEDTRFLNPALLRYLKKYAS